MAEGPLAGVRVIEIAGIGSLPFAGMMLADMGAEILRIDTPRPRELAALTDAAEDPLQRGRAALTLDLKQPAERDRLLDIVARGDVLIEALRPGKMEALGLGPAECHARAPHLVYGRATGWGQEGPLARTAGHDPNYVGYTGASLVIGGDRPALPPFALVGDTVGALYLVIGVLAALNHARASGQGQVVDASILDGTLHMMTGLFALQRQGGAALERLLAMTSGACPFATHYRTADGGWMAVCALEPSFYAAFVAGLGLDAAALPSRDDPRNWPALHERFAERFATRSRAEWEELFAGTDACVSPALTMAEAAHHPANHERAAIHDGLPAAAPRLSATPARHAPAAGGAEPLIKAWLRNKAL